VKLCISGLPELDNAIFLTSRLKPSSKPSLAIPLENFHLLIKALHYDNIIPQSEVDDMMSALQILHDWKIDKLDLEIWETIDYRHEGIIRLLRGYFINEAKGNVIPIVPGLQNVSLVSTLSYKAENYVIDIRDYIFNGEMLKDVLSILEKHGEVYVVDDAPPNPCPFNEILIGENADIKQLKSICDVTKLGEDSILVRSGKVYKVETRRVKWHRETFHIPRYNKPSDVDYLKNILVDERIVSDVLNILYDLMSQGGMVEKQLIERLGEGIGPDLAIPSLFLLYTYGIITATQSPAGRYYMLGRRGMKIVLDHLKKGEDKEVQENSEGGA